MIIVTPMLYNLYFTFSKVRRRADQEKGGVKDGDGDLFDGDEDCLFLGKHIWFVNGQPVAIGDAFLNKFLS